MKKTLSILLVMIMLVGIIAVGTVTASAAVKTDDPAFTDNYVLLDYIENTNGQYIKTGYKAGAGVTVTMDLEITEWNHSYAAIFGSRSGNHSPNSFVMCRNSSYNKLRSEVGANHTADHAVELNTRSDLSLSGSDNISGEGLEIYLFGLNDNNKLETNYGVARYKLYSCKITDNGEIKRDFVPAKRNTDGAIGLFDKQSGDFFESANGTTFEYCHSFDKNGKCTICGATYSFDDYAKGKYGYDKSVSFSGAKSLTVKISQVNAWTGSIDFCDGLGNVIKQYKSVEGVVDYTIEIPGDTLRVSYLSKTLRSGYSSVNGGFRLASITPNYDDSTASVLSDGNIWIIVAVAVLAIGGVAALIIVKKKKKTATANRTNADDEE